MAGRRRYVQINGELIEITNQDYEPERRRGDSALWGDSSYDGMRATDGTDISSRTKHREYMRINGLTTADDYQSSWAKAKQAREQYMQRGGSINRADIERVIAKLQR